MILVDENTVVEVGKFYSVRCAKMTRYANDFTYYMPIIGIAHEDNAFAPALGKHFHVDGRFVGIEGQHIAFYEGFTNQVCEFERPFHKENPYKMFVSEVVIRRRKCKRILTGIKPPKGAYNKGKYADWYNSMVGKSCAGKKCPHLGTVMHESDGKLICPLHNLHGCLKTEKIIPDDISA